MKLYRNAIILVVVLGLLVGAYFFINNKKGSANEDVSEDSTKTITVIELEKDKINQVEFNNENGKFSLKKQGEEWSMDPSSEFPVDSSAADSSASGVSSIIANKLIEENATDLSNYGLDKPATVKIGLSDGSSKELEVGATSPTSDGVYVKVKGESKVYLISSYSADGLKPTRSNFLKKDILPIDFNTLKTYAYEKNGQLQYKFNITSEKTKSEASGSSTATTTETISKVEIVEPQKEEADLTKVTPMFQAVTALTIKDVIDENPTDLSKYGLDKPAFTLEFGDSNTTKKILFGKDVEKGTVLYAKFADKNSVVTIDITGLTFLDVKLADILNVFINIPNIKDVSKIDLFIDGKTVVSEIVTNEEDSDKDQFKVNGKDANMKGEGDKSLFRAFYQAMIGITMDKYEPDAQPSGTPEVTIKYYMKPDSKVVTIDFISKDNNYYYAMKDGVYTKRVVLKSKFDEAEGIRATLKAIEEAQAK